MNVVIGLQPNEQINRPTSPKPNLVTHQPKALKPILRCSPIQTFSIAIAINPSLPSPLPSCNLYSSLLSQPTRTMELRASSIHSLSFRIAFNSWHWETERKPSSRVQFPVCELKFELTPKELHHQRKKEEWKKLRRARRREKLAEQAKVQEREAGLKAERRRVGLCSFEKYKLSKDHGVVGAEWKPGVKGKSTLVSKFEEEFAIRVRDAVKTVRRENSEVEESSVRLREDSHSVAEGEDVSDDWLLAYAQNFNFPGTQFGETVDDDAASEDGLSEVGSGSNLGYFGRIDEGKLASQREERILDTAIVTDFCGNETGEPASASESDSTFVETACGDEPVDNNTAAYSFSGSQLHFIDHSFSSRIPPGGIDNNVVSSDETDAGTAYDEEASLGTLAPRDWRVNPKTPRQKDRAVGHQIVNRRKGEPLSLLLDEISSETHGILGALYEDVTSEVRRKSVDEREQLEWLAGELSQAGKKQKFFLSRLMHGARLKWTDGRLLELVKLLGARREWRRAMEVVHWVQCREHFRHCRSRYVCTTLLAVLGKCLRPVEALNVFNVMREEHLTYPDMAAYHSVAVTLGKAGHLPQLLHLIQSLRKGPMKKIVKGSPKQLNWNGCLEPDIVVYNAVINACGPHRQWEGVIWVLQQMQSSGIAPNSTTYGLAIEVMVKSGQYDKAWRYYEIMERGGFLPNALTFKALVEALGMTGEVDKAIELVQDMESRGVIECAGVYYALASALCTAGRLSEALVQVEKLVKLPSKKPDVVTFTGLIRTCDKVGRWQDAISLFNRMQCVCAPNVGTYNIMIALYGRHHLFEEARNIFESVKRGRHKESRFSQANSRLSPTEHTYESMLGACAVCEDWGYFEVVLGEFYTRGFQLDCRRHAWFISPLVKAGQERLVHLMASRLQPSGSPPSIDLYRILLPLLSMHKQYTLVLNYLDMILDQGVALNSLEWSSIVGNALEQLPIVDAEQFLCTKVTDENNRLVMELLQCLVSVGAEKKARRMASLLGLEMGDGATLGDTRLLPQEDEGIILAHEPVVS